MALAAGRISVKKVLASTKASETGKDVIIVGSGKDGIYISTSMPSRTPREMGDTIRLLERALGSLRKRRAQLLRGFYTPGRID